MTLHDFDLIATDPDRRPRGRLPHRHGPVRTPVFMPVGTRATVKALPEQLREIGAQIVLANTYTCFYAPEAISSPRRAACTRS